MTVQLITGGAGFIGSNYINYFLNKYPDDELICVDALTYAGNINTLEKIIKTNKKFTFIKADIRDKKQIHAIFSNYKPDTVINFAAESHVDRSIKNPQIFLETNIEGTSVLMDASINNNVTRFHQVSTDEVYGDLPLNKPDILFDEDSKINPSSPYSTSKASADYLVKAYERTYGLPVSISRCSNNYGPYQFPEKLIPVVILNAIENKKIPVYGKGENIRDWLYVEDHCKAIDYIVNKAKNGSIYNVGGNNERSNLEIITDILNLLNKPLDLIEYVADRPGHDKRYAINPNKIVKELNWVPDTPYDKGIKYTVQWYLMHKEWCDTIINKKYVDSNKKIKEYTTI